MVGGKLSGVGFYRAWLRYTVATIGLADDIRSGVLTRDAASSAVAVALTDLAAEATPFAGKPRACDLYFIHPLIHQVIENSLAVVQQADLDAVVDHLIAIGDGTTTTTNLGGGENGPLTINDLLALLARVSDELGIDAVHALLTVVRERRNDHESGYSEQAAFELETARICVEAGEIAEARQYWERAAALLASYGGHKDPTLSEIVASVQDIEDTAEARIRLAKLVDLVYLVRQHTDGRDTSHYVTEWWRIAAVVDPIAAARDAADLYLDTVGFDDARAYAAQTHLLQHQRSTADPAVLAALRLTVGADWRSTTVDREILNRLETDCGSIQPIDTMLAVLANNIAASYDNQPMQYTRDQSKEVVDEALIHAVVALGGSRFNPRTVRPDEPNRNSMPWPDSTARPQPLLARLTSSQRPEVPEGRAGLIMIAHSIGSSRYQDGPAVWNDDAATNSIGYRILEATLDNGPDAGMALIDDVAREISLFARNDIFADLGHGLAASANGDPGVAKVASYCLANAYQRIRGGGGWQRFAGRKQRTLWQQAHELDSDTAERVLAAAMTNCIAGESHSSYGSSQGIITAFALQPTTSSGGTAVNCWDAAFRVISNRLPGTAATGNHVYHPTTVPDSSDDLDIAIASLSLATVAQAGREQIRLALLAAGFLLTVRPRIAQHALSDVLGKDLDAGRICWLLETVHVNLSAGGLADDLAARLDELAVSDQLSVRVLAGRLLDKHGRPVPDPPASTPSPQVIAGFRALAHDLGEALQ